MRAIKTSLALAFGLATSQALASFVPIDDELFDAQLETMQGASFVDGYIQLNKTQNTISLILQPVKSRCPDGLLCPDELPLPLDFYFPKTTMAIDACDAVIYRAELATDHLTKVTVVDNTNYNYARCPTLAPVPEAVVQVRQIRFDQTGEETVEDFFSGTRLSAVQF